MQSAEFKALKQYAITLQRENAAKSIQQETLYRQLQSIKNELVSMERYYYECRELRKQIISLKQIYDNQEKLSNELNNIKYENQALQHENQSLKGSIHQTQQQINHIAFDYHKNSQKLQNLQQIIKQLTYQNNLLLIQKKQIVCKYNKIQEENQIIKSKLKDNSRQQLDRNFQQLVSNYEKIEQIVFQKDQNIRQLEVYINQLEQQCKFLNSQFLRTDNYSKQLQQQLRILQAQKNNQNLSQDNISFLTDSISKIDLIRQNNKMLQRITKYENQNYFDGNKEYAYSDSGKDKLNNSQSKLQLRIQTLKMQNKNLLRTLAI